MITLNTLDTIKHFAITLFVWAVIAIVFYKWWLIFNGD